MEPENPLKTPHLSCYHAQMRPGMEFLVIFWAWKLILVIIYQFLPRKAKMNMLFWRFTYRLTDFKATQLNSIVQNFLWTKFQALKLLNTNIVKDFFLAAARVLLLFGASWVWISKNKAF
jgi:hypothetical protein